MLAEGLLIEGRRDQKAADAQTAAAQDRPQRNIVVADKDSLGRNRSIPRWAPA
jgi:hypothetical protein